MSLLNQKIILPTPSKEALAHSQQVVNFIIDKINQQHGRITFAEFMQHALYAPGLGYYSAGSEKFAARGDFTTAPEISPLFAQCFAQQCVEILSHLPDAAIIEFGAGSGKLAGSLMQHLQQNNSLPTYYFIMEISADLKARQQSYLKENFPDFFGRFVWLENLPTTPLNAIIIANEVLDAMPVHRVFFDNNNIAEYYVAWKNDQFIAELGEPSNQILSDKIVRVKNFVYANADPSSYSTEINLFLEPWINSLASFLQQGVILLSDYGFPAHEYYHADRHNGTLMCHYQHIAHDDFFYLPGLQDITAHVDFSAVAAAADESKLTVAGFTTQEAFLLGCGLLDLAQQNNHSLAKNYQTAQAIKKLTLTSEMGELIKVMALTKNYAHPLRGFGLLNKANLL